MWPIMWLIRWLIRRFTPHVIHHVTHQASCHVTHHVTHQVTHQMTHQVTRHVTHHVTCHVTHQVTYHMTRQVTHHVSYQVIHHVTHHWAGSDFVLQQVAHVKFHLFFIIFMSFLFLNRKLFSPFFNGPFWKIKKKTGILRGANSTPWKVYLWVSAVLTSSLLSIFRFSTPYVPNISQ